MKIKGMPIIIIVFGGLVIVSLLLFVFTTIIGSRETKEWNSFRKETLIKYSQISKMTVYGINASLFINITSNKKFDDEVVKEIFEDTRKFISDEQAFNGIQKKQLRQYKNYITGIYINFYNMYDDTKIDYQFFSPKGENGVSTENSFSKWYIKTSEKGFEEYGLTNK